MAEQREDELARRVHERLDEWNARYAAEGASSASPLMDAIVAEEEVIQEMKAEGRWPTRTEYGGEGGHDE